MAAVLETELDAELLGHSQAQVRLLCMLHHCTSYLRKER